MDDKPRNLRTMLSEAKDTSELMVDLAYAAVYFGDPQMAEEVEELEERLNALVHDMRAVCVLAAHRGRHWFPDVGGDETPPPGDALFLHGSPGGIAGWRQLAGGEGGPPP